MSAASSTTALSGAELPPIPELLPHAGDMMLLDELVAFDDEGVVVRLTVRPDTLLSQADGSLPAWSGIELMAQCVAAYGGCQAHLAGKPVEPGFLLGTRRYHCNVDRFPAGTELRLQARRSLQDENGMGVFDCVLEGPGIRVDASLNVFRPPQVDSYLKESPL